MIEKTEIFLIFFGDYCSRYSGHSRYFIFRFIWAKGLKTEKPKMLSRRMISLVQTEITYTLIDGNLSKKKPVAYCKSKKAYLVEGQLKLHRCLQLERGRGCINLQKLQHEFWDKRAERKRLRKERRIERYH
jgi:hypothetical protein